jgi:hypothetical protein
MEQVAQESAVAGIEVILMATLMWAGTKAFFIGLRTTGILVACGATLSLASAAASFLVNKDAGAENSGTTILTLTAAGHTLLAMGIVRLILVMDRREQALRNPD